MDDFLDRLRRDTIEQFRDKPNIDVYQKALARQLSELYAFFTELDTLQWLQNAEGVQLDGIGDFELRELGLYMTMIPLMIGIATYCTRSRRSIRRRAALILS